MVNGGVLDGCKLWSGCHGSSRRSRAKPAQLDQGQAFGEVVGQLQAYVVAERVDGAACRTPPRQGDTPSLLERVGLPASDPPAVERLQSGGLSPVSPVFSFRAKFVAMRRRALHQPLGARGQRRVVAHHVCL